MAGKKGMKHYPESFKKEVIKEYENGESIRSLHRKYGISRYAIQTWCGLVNLEKEHIPKRKGRPRKKPITTQEELVLENKRLNMENELLRNFLQSIGRR